MRRLLSYKQYKAPGLCTPLMATVDYQVAAVAAPFHPDGARIDGTVD
jgi:hypothetical protein